MVDRQLGEAEAGGLEGLQIADSILILADSSRINLTKDVKLSDDCTWSKTEESCSREKRGRHPADEFHLPLFYTPGHPLSLTPTSQSVQSVSPSSVFKSLPRSSSGG